jgi:hypothetical protein
VVVAYIRFGSIVIVGCIVSPGLGQVVTYDGSHFPEEGEDGWTRLDSVYQADRWIDNGWLVQSAEIAVIGPPEEGERDFYRRELADQAGSGDWYLEWVMWTDGPQAFASVSPAVIAAGGTSGVLYQLTVAEDRIRLLRDATLPLVFADIEPGLAHTYRLELHGSESYAFSIDGTVIDAGIPEGPYPTSDSRITFGASAAIEGSATRWDYIRFGVIPEPSSGLMLLVGCLVIRRKHR